MSDVIIRSEYYRLHEVGVDMAASTLSLHTDIAVKVQLESSGDDLGQ